MKTLLVTGASGLIGSEVVEACCHDGRPGGKLSLTEIEAMSLANGVLLWDV
jgi:nucleoside-diphosphate-sugar epimerase